MGRATDAVGRTSRPRSKQHRLLVIVGPIASGKSTLASQVADLLRSAGEAVAVVGLDTVAEMALPTLGDWAWAHEVHGRVVGAWLATPIPTVIAEGPETPAEADQLMRHVPHDVSVLTVLLVTRYETALKRAIADSGRGVSKDPAFLAKMYQRFENQLHDIAYDLRLDSGESSPDELAEHVIRALT